MFGANRANQKKKKKLIKLGLVVVVNDVSVRESQAGEQPIFS